MTFAAERFLRATAWNDDVPNVLEKLGTALAASRIYVFESSAGSSGEVLSLRFKWTAPGADSFSFPQQSETVSCQGTGCERWLDTLAAGEPLYGRLAELPVGECPAWISRDVQSVALAPIFVGDRWFGYVEDWWGLIGIDDSTDRDWSQPEIDALQAVAAMLGAAISRQRADEQLQQTLEREQSNAAQLRELITERVRLLQRTVQASEDERTLIAAELHDGPIQRLTAVLFLLQRAERRLASHADAVLPDLVTRAVQELSAEINQLRTMMTQLRPPTLDLQGLAHALEDHVHDVTRAHDLRCAVSVQLSERLDASTETALYRIAQEAIANVIKHANAQRAWLTLKDETDSVVLEVCDDGIGFDADQTVNVAGANHFGLTAMRERTQMVGGHWSITSTPGAGTTIRVIIPKRRNPQPLT